MGSGKRERLAEIIDQAGIARALLWARKRTASPWLPVLTYHRISDPAAEPLFDRGVIDATPEQFDRQVEMLTRYFTTIGVDDLPAILGVTDEINQSILNLVVNAAHAIGDALVDRPGEIGRITLRTRREDAWVVIEVEDTGTGIPERARAHMFEPFFTTKPAGRGTGQGLALVHTMIVKHHEGMVDFTTELGRGTTFRVRLPIAPAPTSNPAESAPQDEPTSVAAP